MKVSVHSNIRATKDKTYIDPLIKTQISVLTDIVKMLKFMDSDCVVVKNQILKMERQMAAVILCSNSQDRFMEHKRKMFNSTLCNNTKKALEHLQLVQFQINMNYLTDSFCYQQKQAEMLIKCNMNVDKITLFDQLKLNFQELIRIENLLHTLKLPQECENMFHHIACHIQKEKNNFIKIQLYLEAQRQYEAKQNIMEIRPAEGVFTNIDPLLKQQVSVLSGMVKLLRLVDSGSMVIKRKVFKIEQQMGAVLLISKSYQRFMKNKWHVMNPTAIDNTIKAFENVQRCEFEKILNFLKDNCFPQDEVDDIVTAHMYDNAITISKVNFERLATIEQQLLNFTQQYYHAADRLESDLAQVQLNGRYQSPDTSASISVAETDKQVEYYSNFVSHVDRFESDLEETNVCTDDEYPDTSTATISPSESEEASSSNSVNRSATEPVSRNKTWSVINEDGSEWVTYDEAEDSSDFNTDAEVSSTNKVVEDSACQNEADDSPWSYDVEDSAGNGDDSPWDRDVKDTEWDGDDEFSPWNQDDEDSPWNKEEDEDEVDSPWERDVKESDFNGDDEFSPWNKDDEGSPLNQDVEDSFCNGDKISFPLNRNEEYSPLNRDEENLALNGDGEDSPWNRHEEGSTLNIDEEDSALQGDVEDSPWNGDDKDSPLNRDEEDSVLNRGEEGSALNIDEKGSSLKGDEEGSDESKGEEYLNTDDDDSDFDTDGEEAVISESSLVLTNEEDFLKLCQKVFKKPSKKLLYSKVVDSDSYSSLSLTESQEVDSSNSAKDGDTSQTNTLSDDKLNEEDKSSSEVSESVLPTEAEPVAPATSIKKVKGLKPSKIPIRIKTAVEFSPVRKVPRVVRASRIPRSITDHTRVRNRSQNQQTESDYFVKKKTIADIFVNTTFESSSLEAAILW